MKRIFAFAGLAVVAMQVYQLPVHLHDPYSDTEVYSRAARHCAAGEQVYGDWPRTRLDLPPNEFIYPPTALALLCPFGRVDGTVFRTVQLALTLVAFWVLAGALDLLATGALSVTGTLAAGALSQLAGVGMMTSSGNADVVVLAMVAWAFAVPRAAAALLVGAAAIKIYPFFILAAWLPTMTKRQVRVGAFAALGVIGLYWMTGAHRYYHEWNTIGQPALSELVLPAINWSLSALPLRPFFSGDGVTTPGWVHAFLTGVSLAAVLGSLFLSRKQSRDVVGCAVLLTSVAFAPICWWWRLTVALTIPAALWIRKRKELSCEL